METTAADPAMLRKARNAWRNMRARCLDASALGYRNYGGRGITICGEWSSFGRFVADMGLPPSADHSIDRIDNDGNYEPGNCRWATREEQARNKRGAVKVWNGDAWEAVRTWADRVGIDYDFAYLCVHYWKYNAEETLAAQRERLAKRSPATVAYLARRKAERAEKAKRGVSP